MLSAGTRTRSLDVPMLTETWLMDTDDICLRLVMLQGLCDQRCHLTAWSRVTKLHCMTSPTNLRTSSSSAVTPAIRRHGLAMNVALNSGAVGVSSAATDVHGMLRIFGSGSTSRSTRSTSSVTSTSACGHSSSWHSLSPLLSHGHDVTRTTLWTASPNSSTKRSATYDRQLPGCHRSWCWSPTCCCDDADAGHWLPASRSTR